MRIEVPPAVWSWPGGAVVWNAHSIDTAWPWWRPRPLPGPAPCPPAIVAPEPAGTVEAYTGYLPELETDAAV